MIAAIGAPAADEIEAFFNFFQEARDFVGIMLQVAIHGNDHVAAGKIEAGF